MQVVYIQQGSILIISINQASIHLSYELNNLKGMF